MARYTKDLTLNLPEETVQYVVNDYLQKSQFTAADWQGKPCFRTGSTMMGYKWLKWSYGGGVFHLEAWLESNTGKEIGLDGVMGAVTKMPYKASVNQLLETLESQAQSGATPASAPKTVDNSNQAIAGLVCGILALLISFVWALLGMLLGIVGVTISQFGIKSSKAILAKVGLVLSIIAMVLAFITIIIQFIGVLSSVGSSL